MTRYRAPFERELRHLERVTWRWERVRRHRLAFAIGATVGVVVDAVARWAR